MSPKWLPRQWLALAIVLVLCVLPLVSTTPVQYIAASIGIWAIFAMGFDLAFGVAGLLSFGHAAFFGIGAYATAIAATRYGVPVTVGLLMAMACSAIFAALVGMLTLRLSGIYLGLTTLALAQLLETLIAVRLREFSGGFEGIVAVPRPVIAGVALDQEMTFYGFVAVVFAAVLAIMIVLRASPWGQALVAMRINETRARQIGFNVLRLKIEAFAISGAISGLAGGLLSSLMRFVSPEVLHWTISGDVLIISLLGGSATLLGPAAGALIVGLLRELLGTVTSHWHGLLGVVFVLATLYLPRGAAGLVRMPKWTGKPR